MTARKTTMKTAPKTTAPAEVKKPRLRRPTVEQLRRINLDDPNQSPLPFAATPFANSVPPQAPWVAVIREIEMGRMEYAAISLAASKHSGKKYGESIDYMAHLAHVRNVMATAILTLGITGEENVITRRYLLASTWCHDLLEDCGINYNDLARTHELGYTIAEYVFCVSGHGRNRKERFESVRPLLVTNHGALLLKACDRIGNLYFSSQGASSKDRQMFAVYREEMSEFMRLFPEAHENATDTVTDFSKPLWSKTTISAMESWFNKSVAAITEAAA
jgi:hypothetical protein